MLNKIRNSQLLFTSFLVLISLLKISLMSASPWELGLSGYDDLLQLKNSVSLAAGEWLGAEYSYLTMAKNIGYPLFLALVQGLNLPYGTVYGFFMVVVSLLFTRAISPLIRHKGTLLIIYTVILFTPIAHWSVFRIYRNALVPWTFLLVLSCLIGLFIRRRDKLGKLLLWSSGSFVAIMYFWILREDSIWIFPLLLVASLLTLLGVWSDYASQPKEFWSRLIVVCLPLLAIGAVTVLVAGKNGQKYGVSALNDRTQTYAPKVMTLLYKIEDNQDKSSHIWLSRSSLQLAIKVSPSLQKIENQVLSSYDAWAGKNEDIAGDISQWALRNAVKDAGYYRNNAKKTDALYQSIYKELKTAFNQGQLQPKKGFQLSSQTGVFQVKDLLEAFQMTWQILVKVALYQNTELDPADFNTESLSVADLTFFETILNTSIPKTEKQLRDLGVYTETYTNHDLDLVSTSNALIKTNESLIKTRLDSLRIQQSIVSIYKVLSFIAVPLSVIGYFLVSYQLMRQRWPKNQALLAYFLLMTASFLASFLNIFIVTLFSRWLTTDTSSMIYGFYASTAYLLNTVFVLLGCLALFYWLMTRQKKNVSVVK